MTTATAARAARNADRRSGRDKVPPASSPAVDEAAMLAEARRIREAEEFERMWRALGLMLKNWRREIDLEAAARPSGLSRFHFHRRFKAVMGMTPKRVITLKQIAAAKRLLRRGGGRAGGGVPLAEIAERCGFAHHSHFTSRFKQVVGLPPLRWLRQAGPTGEKGR